MRAPRSTLDAAERGIRVHLLVFDELDRRHAVRIQHAGELLDGGRFAVNLIRLGILPHEDVDEAGRMLLFLPDLVSQRARLVRPNVRDELVDRGETLLERLRSDLVAGQLMDLAGTALNARHGDLSRRISEGRTAGKIRLPTQRTALLTRAAILASSAALSSFRAKEVGHIAPSS